MADVSAALERIFRRQYFRHTAYLRLMTRASHCIARFCVYGPDGGNNKIGGRNIRRVHRLWLRRLFTLCQHNLWLPLRHATTDSYALDNERLESAFRRHAYCRPGFAIRKESRRYIPRSELPPDAPANMSAAEFEALAQAHTPKKKSHRPCKRFNFCPHCFAAVVAAQYRAFKGVLNRWRRVHAEPLYVAAHITEQRVHAPDFDTVNFNDAAKTRALIEFLTEILQRCVQHVKKQNRSLRKKTHGTLWRLVVIPDDDGWAIQVRRLIIAQDETATKNIRIQKHARVILNRRLAVTGLQSWQERRASTSEDDLSELFCAVSMYPRELLVADPELVAIQLHATAALKMIGGTGVLRKNGDRRIREHKKQAANGRANAKR